ncbi:deoxyribose-phosphate aldolase [Verrucosispora sp. FIM060022]|uniref:deoxyribose-phosphate aldolase n=1 Tax=Verrucosispora sp. FIM060022 TaxID=1479020 RepID=UPI000F86CFA1|nr:deoxyribose-phosphate aldolase [Verrucosispora sp. FIM060022]RUL95166.1 deoxyribose-phosphate aldolase [Verrucosispora sp. FIM060022]
MTSATTALPADLTPAALAPYIQHTLIEVGTTRDRMIKHAEEALRYGFNAAMVPGSWVSVVADVLRGSGVQVASALDFPTVGVTTSAGKAYEAESLVRAGAQQIDIGVQIGWLKSGMYDEFREDIAGVVRASGVPIKVMLELPLLTEAERETAVELSIEAGAAYLKNASSGAIEVANPASIGYLVDRAGGRTRVKASGSIKSYPQAVGLLRAGAELLGTSAGIAIVTDSANEETVSY